MSGRIWGGIPTKHMQWFPCPLISSPIRRLRFVDSMDFENGGGDVVRSHAYQTEFGFEFFGPAHTLEGIDDLTKLASGFYGSGLVYFAHPALFATNMFSAGWASPGMIERGWPNIGPVQPTFYDTGGGVSPVLYGNPDRTALFDLTEVELDSVGRKFTLPIPPGHTAALGWSGIQGGGGRIVARPIFANGGGLNPLYDTPQELTPLSVLGATRVSDTFSGDTYRAVEVYLTNVELVPEVTSIVGITSMMARIFPSAGSVVWAGDHVVGMGSTGMEFVDDAVVENYAYMHPPLKGMSSAVREVEAWR